MIVQAVWVDLATLFRVQPNGVLELFPDVLTAFEQWRAIGVGVVGITTDARRYGPQLSSFFGEALPVVDQPLPRWRQVGTWLGLAEEMNVSPGQIAFIASTPMLMGFARQAGLRALGVLRDPHTMTVLEGVWVDGLSAIPWRDLAGETAL